MHNIKNQLQFLWYQFCDPRLQLLGRLIFTIGLLFISLDALADGDDLLKGTDASWWATFNGAGKNYLYAGEGVVTLIGFIKTRNPAVFVVLWRWVYLSTLYCISQVNLYECLLSHSTTFRSAIQINPLDLR